MNRKVHQAIDVTLTGVGIAVIISSVMLSDAVSLQLRLLCAIVGVLLTEAGVWGIAGKFMPNERRFGRLREEGDRMIKLIRQLNGAALARDQGVEDGSRFQATLDEMHQTVRLMADLAALEDDHDLDAVLVDSSQAASASEKDEDTAFKPA